MKHRGKIFVAGILLLGVLLTESVCEKIWAKEIHIGIAMASDESSYQKNLADVMEEIASDKKSYTVEFCYANWDAELQEEQLWNLIEKKVDAIILCPVNAKSFLNVLREAQNEEIPVVNLNMKVDSFSSEYITTYVGGSMSEEANLAAELVADYFGEESGKVGIIEGFPGSDPQIYRTQTFLEEMIVHPNIEIVGIVNGKWSRDIAELAALDLLNKDPDLDMIYCHDCNMAMGAYDVLVKQGKEDEISIIGIGDVIEYEDALREGKLYGIISQSIEYEAEYALICAEKAARGDILRSWYKNPCEVVTKETVDEYRVPMEQQKIVEN